MPDPSPSPTFVLGLGAQKAGTTWLHAYLAASPAHAPGLRKEYHVLDAIDVAEESWKVRRIAPRLERAAERVALGERGNAFELQRTAMIWEDSLYPAYFAGLAGGRAPGGGPRFSMDVTPSYALLGAPRLRWVRESFAERGVRAVAVFLMRDPVDRLHSQVRFFQRRRPEQHPGTTEEEVLRLYGDPAFASRSRYERTLAAIAGAFAPDAVHVGFYETLFTDASVDAVCRLVGIDRHPADFDHRPHDAGERHGLSDETERLVAEHLRETYAAVAHACPDVDLRALWPSSRWVL